MRKLFFVLLLCNKSFAQIKHGYFRDVDSTGLISIITTEDTISNSNDACTITGIIFNEDSTNHYFMQFKFKAPLDIYLSNDYKIRIKSKKGDTTDLMYYGRDGFINQGQEVLFSSLVSEDILKKMKNSRISSVSLIKDDFVHSINLNREFNKRMGKLSEFLLTVDVYKEKEMSWLELSQFKFPEN